MSDVCRWVFASELGAMVCEIGVACCTLLQIFSLQNSRRALEDGDESQLNSQMALGLVSLLMTCAALLIMCMGASVALRIMYTVWNTVMPSNYASRHASSRGLAMKSGRQMTDIEGDEAEQVLVCTSARHSNAG